MLGLLAGSCGADSDYAAFVRGRLGLRSVRAGQDCIGWFAASARVYMHSCDAHVLVRAGQCADYIPRLVRRGMS